MARPLPVRPRGPRRRRVAAERLLLACPRVSPDWELGALRALMKPQTKHAILHRPAEQPWPADAARRVEAARQFAVARLAYDPEPQLPAAGDYRLIVNVPETQRPHATAFAVVLSHALPGLWLVLGGLYVKDGRFFRRARGFQLKLVLATNVHLPRATRAALRTRDLRVAMTP